MSKKYVGAHDISRWGAECTPIVSKIDKMENVGGDI